MKIKFIFAAVVSFAYLSEGHCLWYKRLERAVSKAGRDVEHVVREVSPVFEEAGRNIGREIEQAASKAGHDLQHVVQQISPEFEEATRNMGREIERVARQVRDIARNTGDKIERDVEQIGAQESVVLESDEKYKNKENDGLQDMLNKEINNSNSEKENNMECFEN